MILVEAEESNAGRRPHNKALDKAIDNLKNMGGPTYRLLQTDLNSPE
jgi:hypothetical protein